MKRDMDLIRKMVLAIEDAPGGFAPRMEFDGYTADQIGYHSHLMIQAGLATGVDGTHLESSGPEAHLRTLTWEGHEFAAASRNDTIWKQAKAKIGATVGTVSLSVLTDLLKKLAAVALANAGIP